MKGEPDDETGAIYEGVLRTRRYGWLGLAAARSGRSRKTLALTPERDMRGALAFAHDYDALRGMIFGSVPSLEAVIESIAGLKPKLIETGMEHIFCFGIR